MPDTRTLAERIDAELSAARDRSALLKQQVVDHEPGRWQRLKQVDQRLTEIRQLWRDRLAELSHWFGDRLQTQAQVASGRRQATFAIKSSRAEMELRFSIFTDDDVRNVIFQYDLDVSPANAAYDAHSELSFPYDQIDEHKLVDWLYGRLIVFVKTYLAIHEE